MSNNSPKPLTHLTGRCVPLNRHNVDTDQIIPARFLKGTAKTGLGKHLFNDWRYGADGAPLADFPLNQPRYEGASILVAGHNFGCGSSREHAPWALKDYGIGAVLAISFADIFKNNALKNQVLPVVLSEAVIQKLLADVEQDPTLEVAIDLSAQTVTLPGSHSQQDTHPFEINSFWKQCLLEGVDQIGYTLGRLPAIEQYEARREDLRWMTVGGGGDDGTVALKEGARL